MNTNLNQIKFYAGTIQADNDPRRVGELADLIVQLCGVIEEMQMELEGKLDDPELVSRPASQPKPLTA